MLPTSESPLWAHFIAWLTGAYTDEWWQGPGWAVALPLFLSVVLAARQPHMLRDGAFWSAVVACALACGLTARWSEDAELGQVSLHMAPLALFVIAVSAWRGRCPGVAEAYVGSFLSLLAPDVLHTLWRFGPENSDWLYLHGIGGAGMGDGLFVFPLVSAALVVYARWRMRLPLAGDKY